VPQTTAAQCIHGMRCAFLQYCLKIARDESFKRDSNLL
jgi:hypothetical protein